MALRFSGRLMVIQRLDPRFSTRTLEVSVMAFVRLLFPSDNRTRRTKEGSASIREASWFETPLGAAPHHEEQPHREEARAPEQAERWRGGGER
jgi:hypothetical protein